MTSREKFEAWWEENYHNGNQRLNMECSVTLGLCKNCQKGMSDG